MIIIAPSCSYFKKKDIISPPLARVFGSYLYENDIADLVPPGSSAKDSMIFVKRFIDVWIKKQLFLNKANEYLSDEQIYRKIENQMEDYRTSLIIYAYKSELVRQKLDSFVSGSDLEKYYNEHLNLLKLKDDILKVKFIKLSVNSPDYEQVREWSKSDREEDIEKLQQYCHRYANGFLLNDKSWILFEDLKRELPAHVELTFNMLMTKKYIELEDSMHRYIIIVTDIMPRNSTAPLDYEKENLKNSILNKRKNEIVRNAENKVYQNAIDKNFFEIYK